MSKVRSEQIRASGPSLWNTSSDGHRRAHVRPISQVNLELRDGSGDAAFDTARHEVLNWLDERAGSRLSNEAKEGKPFILEDVGAQRAEAVLSDSPRLWAVRFDDPDARTPQRVWTTEVAIGEVESGASLFGMRLLCSELGGETGFPRSVPKLVREVVSQGQAFLSGVRLDTEPWQVGSDEVERLVDLLVDGRRHVDAIVFSLADESDADERTMASARSVARQATGTTHVVVLSAEASFGLSDRVGREFSVFGEAVRTYRPGFNPDTDDPFTHPLALPKAIAEWASKHGTPFQTFLVQQALRRSVAGSDLVNQLPPFGEIRRHANFVRREKERSEASTDKELLELAMEEIDELKVRLQRESDENEDLLESAESERDHAAQEAQQLRTQVSHLRNRVRGLEDRLREAGDGEEEPLVPEDLEGLEEWAERVLGGDVVLHNRALRGAKRSEYEDPSLIYRSLLLLRD